MQPLPKTVCELTYNENERKLIQLLGFDPIDKQFKVLYMEGYYWKILTLGIRELRWREIQGSLSHEPTSRGLCINGVLYYL